MDCSLPGFCIRGILQEKYLNGLPFPIPGDLPDPGMEPTSLALQEESVLSEPRVLLSYNYFDNQKHPPQISKTSPMGQFQTPWEPLHSGTIALYVQ